jgi:hypothetical protein
MRDPAACEAKTETWFEDFRCSFWNLPLDSVEERLQITVLDLFALRERNNV